MLPQLQNLTNLILQQNKLKIGLMQIRYVDRHTLLSALSNDLFNVYYSYKEAKEIWDSLIMKYTAKDVVRQRFVIGNYYAERWSKIKTSRFKSTNITSYLKISKQRTYLCLMSLFQSF